MDTMMLGETLAHKTAATTRFEGYWMPAGGNSGVGGVEVFFATSTGKWTVNMETKSSDASDVGGGVSTVGGAGATVSATTQKIYNFDVANAKDLVRYVVTCDDEASDQFMHFQLCQPLWAPN